MEPAFCVPSRLSETLLGASWAVAFKWMNGGGSWLSIRHPVQFRSFVLSTGIGVLGSVSRVGIGQ